MTKLQLVDPKRGDVPRTTASPIRVLHVCQRDDPSTGGAVQVAATLVEQLKDEPDIEARLLFLYGGRGAFFQRLGQRCDYLHLQSSKDVPLRWHRFYRHLSNCDIVHHHDMLSWTNCCSISALQVKRIFHAHLPRAGSAVAARFRLCDWLQTKRLIRLLAITHDVEQSWVGNLKSPPSTCIVPNGVDASRFRPAPEKRGRFRSHWGFASGDKVVGYVGRLHNQMKGVDDFIRTISLLPENYKAIVVGEGPDRYALTCLSRDLGIHKRVEFTGAISEPENAYAGMDALLFTSHYEPFGLTPLEGIASGVPVFAFRCKGGFNEWASGGLVCTLNSRDHKLMANQILQELCNGVASARATQALEEVRRRFSSSAMAAKIADIYRQVMDT